MQVKAVFYALCFGDDAPTRRAAANFVECFYRLEERTETTTDVLEDGTVVVQTTVYYVAIPLPLETVYENLAAWQGEPVTDEDKANAAHIYSMVVAVQAAIPSMAAIRPVAAAAWNWISPT